MSGTDGFLLKNENISNIEWFKVHNSQTYQKKRQNHKISQEKSIVGWWFFVKLRFYSFLSILW
jgi:hypothetical protein